MVQARAPYRFVPASPLVVLPDWAEQVSHDTPLADGLCGELGVTLTNHTPLCVGGRQRKATEKARGRVYMFRVPSGEPAIPGSSIKGMLRNLLKIAAFGHFNQVEDQKLGVRDITQANNFYFKAAPPTTVRAGWLRFNDGHWRITPCRQFSRVHQDDLITACGIKTNDWKKCSTAMSRYDLIGLEQILAFRRERMTIEKRESEWQAIPDPSADNKGVIVVTGQPGKPFDEDHRSKKFEFVFHLDGKTAALPVSAEVMAAFFRIHEDSKEWKFWNGKLRNNTLTYGVPVFFHTTGDQVQSLGLAMMYKVPYTYSLHDAIGHTAKQHLDSSAPDLADLIFGKLDEAPNASLRGRVNIGFATTDNLGTKWEGSWTGPTVLNSPKPTFYPAYIRQRENAQSWSQLMEKHAELAGWKRYPPKANEVLPPPAESKSSVQIELETVPAKTPFFFKLRFHNLQPVELGALLWCLDFGNRPDLRHGLGAGKPYGLGQVSLQIDHKKTRLRANNTALFQASDADVLAACRVSFTDFMDQALRNSGAETKWQECSPIQALLNLCNPVSDKGNSGLGYLRAPKDFVELKKTRDRSGPTHNIEHIANTFHNAEPLQAHQPENGHTYTNHLDLLIDAAIGKRKQREEDAIRDREKDAASLEQRALMDFQDLLRKVNGAPSKTQKNHIAKQLNELGKMHIGSCLDEQQTKQLANLAREAAEFDVPKIQSAANKILRPS